VIQLPVFENATAQANEGSEEINTIVSKNHTPVSYTPDHDQAIQEPKTSSSLSGHSNKGISGAVVSKKTEI
jgi:hypothetical protein